MGTWVPKAAPKLPRHFADMEPAAQQINRGAIENLLQMALDRTTHGRGALAESILQVCLQTNSNLLSKEFEITFDILRKLIGDVEMEVRRAIAERLATRGDLPHDIALFLANDQIEVAYPVLVDSAALEDIDLIMITRGKPASHQIAATLRRNLSEAVSKVLVETQSADVIDSLLRNPTAQIATETMEKVVTLSQSMTLIHRPLIQREDLPADLAWRMYGWVGAALKNFIVDTFPESDSDIGSEIDDVIERALASSEILEPAAAAIPVSDLLRGLETESLDNFKHVFTQFSGLRQDAMQTILFDAGGESLAIVCKACGIPIGDFLRIYVLVRAKVDDGVRPESAEFGTVNTVFKRLEIKSANSILSEWRAAAPLAPGVRP